MTWLAKQAHTRNLKLGLYAAASVETCRRTPSMLPRSCELWTSSDRLLVTAGQFPGSQGYEEVDAQSFADWG